MNTQVALKVFTTSQVITDNLSIIENKCEELRDLKRKIASLDKIKESLENDIKSFMQDREELINNSGDVIATWKISITKTWDQKKLKESGLDLDNFYIEKQRRVFLIK